MDPLRTFLIIFAAVGALAVCLALAIGLGLFRLSALDRRGVPAYAGATTRMADAEDDDSSDADPTADGTATRPAAAGVDEVPLPGDRTVVLRPADAKVSGRKIKV